MRWILVIALFFAGLGAFPVGQEQSVLSSSSTIDSGLESETIDIFQFDFSDLIDDLFPCVLGYTTLQ